MLDSRIILKGIEVGEQILDDGLVHVYTGNGKGKTTAALGLAFRAIGHGLKAYMIQFMKGDLNYGEILSANSCNNLTIVQFGRDCFVDRNNPEKVDIDLAKKALEHAKEIIGNGEYDLVILDEVNVALEWKLIETEDVIELIRDRPKNVELVLTGRYAPQEIIDIGDYVTEMRETKHPYEHKISARIGIEY